MKIKPPLYSNMYEAKTQLSHLVACAREGQEVILMIRGEPVAKLISYVTPPTARQQGFAKDISLLKGFDEIPEDFSDYV